MTQLLAGFKEVGNSYMTQTNNNVLPHCLGNKVKISGKLQEISVFFFNLLKLKRKSGYLIQAVREHVSFSAGQHQD